MLDTVLPIFLVIFTGYLFAKNQTYSQEATKLINNFVLFVALPALLFLSVAQAQPAELLHWEFVFATLVGIFLAYTLGIFLAISKSVDSPKSAIIAMSTCYGTTGYMGIPIAIAAFGQQAAVPAAIATILHNIPAIMAVIVTYGISKNNSKNSTLDVLVNAVKTTVYNPLTLAVIAGIFFSFFSIPLPMAILTFSEFIAVAAGPTALFTLGVGLATLSIKNHMNINDLLNVSPIIIIKIFIQPLVTFLVAYYWLGMDSSDIYFIVAILMVAQPIGAGAYVFANQYNFFQKESSIAIITSLLITLVTLSILLEIFK